MSDFRFANPQWAHAIWLVVATLTLLFWLDWRRGDLLSRFVSATMQARLVRRLSTPRRWLSIACLGMAGLCLVLALMRPQWGATYHETPRAGAQIMVCLDVSKSMLAEDTAPNRLERAKAELIDLLTYLDGDQVGLIAFAGRATVLCPLTPDFGFFRLILDGAGTHSVGRGGTRLEEPIRKALAGFRTESDVSRILLLITDGEDHDSHPMDAAQAAAERGLKILAIGFGDEGGSEIYVTDPRSGARTRVRDANGQPVITRLDGDTLRDMALATDGAYIPAGTGALDLKSIYDAHIAPLVRGQVDGRGRVVRREAFQWAVLAGIAFLVAAVGIGSANADAGTWGAPVSSPRGRSSGTAASGTSGGRASAGTLAMMLLVSAAWIVQSAVAQEPPAPNAATSTPHAQGVDAAEQPASTGIPPARATANSTEPVDARVLYNQGLAHLDTDYDQAEQMLIDARRDAATDGDVRFRATYNLGWVEVKRADDLIDDQPREALIHLRRAADWFRDAVRLRPDHRDARHNLEVVLRRVLELADSLARQDERDLAARLDELIGSQREIVGTARQLVDRVAAERDPNGVDRFRNDFRQVAVAQRKLLADSQMLSNSAGEELEALHGKGDEEKTPQDKVRAAQLSHLLHYLNRANQRLGQARGQMRRRQAERAFRRAAAALDEMKRARDQLRGPVEVLDVILADAESLVQQTSAKAMAVKGRSASPIGANGDPPLNFEHQLSWLTQEFLEQTQQSLTDRTAELLARLQAAIDQRPPADDPSSDGPQADQAQEEFLSMIEDAMPFMQEGQGAFEAASKALATQNYEAAAEQQVEAVEALQDARERFLDLRGLIELAYVREVDVQRLISFGKIADDTTGHAEHGPLETSEPVEDESSIAEQLPTEAELSSQLSLARQLQLENLNRADRIANLLEKQLSDSPLAAGEDDGPPSSQSAEQARAQQAHQQQLQVAQDVLELARREMTDAEKLMHTLVAQQADATGKSASSSAQPDSSSREREALIEQTRGRVERAVDHLQTLRRLFFSIVEHLRETAQRQAELNDTTEQMAVLADESAMRDRVGPLTLRQRELESIASEVARALREQANQNPAAADHQQVDPQTLERHQQITQQLLQASQLVAEGSEAMKQAAEQMSSIPDLAGAEDAESTQGGESRPTDELTESSTDADDESSKPARADANPLVQVRQQQDVALQKLIEAVALLQPPHPPPSSNATPQDPSEGQEPSEQDNEQNQRSAAADPSRLLQAVRDREAQRRRERERRGRFQQVPVEKDW